MASETEPSGAAAQKLAELGLSLNPNIPYNVDSLFPKLSGRGAKGEIKQKHQLIQKAEPLIGQMLVQNEEILYVAKGIQFNQVELYFLSVWALMINQTVFVLTNLRLILIHSDTKGNPRHMIWQIYYNQVEKFKPSWTQMVTLKLKDGKQFTTGFQGTDRKQMPEILENALGAYAHYGFHPPATQSRENLCNKCLQIVPKDQYVCSNCQQQFWKPGQIALRSLMFPSWGDFLMGHTVLAIVELIGYVVSWMAFLAIMSWMVFRFGGPGAITMVVPLGVWLVILCFEHSIDAGLTYFIAKKGLTPRK